MSDPVVIFRTQSDVEASIVRSLLESHGIRAVLWSEVPHALFPVSVGRLGEVRVAVHASEADEARALIDGYRSEAAEPGVVRLRDEFVELEARVDYRFRDRGLLEQALTHRSKAQEDVTGGVTDNESLEFLGDAVLGFIVADVLYREFPQADEGEKSKIKAALVSTPSLARVAHRLGIGDFLLLGRGEEKTGGRQKSALLADGCEALIAAIYMDGGLEAARGFVVGQLRPSLERARRPGLLTALTGDYKSALQELLQARESPPPEYRVTSEAGPDHRKRFEVEVWTGEQRIGEAGGRSKKEAEQLAAHRALAALGAEVDE